MSKDKEKPKIPKLNLSMVFLVIGFILVAITANDIIKAQWGVPISDVISGKRDTFIPLSIPETVLETLMPELEEQHAYIPERIVIPRIELDAPIKNAYKIQVEIEGKKYTQFMVPEEFAAGWHEGSAGLGEIGNTVLSGHHNAFEEVFGKLERLKEGDIIFLFSNDETFEYIITNRMILEERDVSLETKMENARWIMPTQDERITLVTCWPRFSNTHRLIIVAVRYSDPTSLTKIPGMLNQTVIPTAYLPTLPLKPTPPQSASLGPTSTLTSKIAPTLPLLMAKNNEASIIFPIITATETVVDKPDAFSLGDIVRVSGTENKGLLLRENAGLSRVTLFFAKEGECFKIIGGPVFVDDYFWWQIQSVAQSFKKGWSVQDYLLVYLSE